MHTHKNKYKGEKLLTHLHQKSSIRIYRVKKVDILREDNQLTLRLYNREPSGLDRNTSIFFFLLFLFSELQNQQNSIRNTRTGKNQQLKIGWINSHRVCVCDEGFLFH